MGFHNGVLKVLFAIILFLSAAPNSPYSNVFGIAPWNGPDGGRIHE